MHRFVSAFRCESIPASAADYYAAIKVRRRESGLSMNEIDLWVAATALAIGATQVSHDNDFAGIEGLSVVKPV